MNLNLRLFFALVISTTLSFVLLPYAFAFSREGHESIALLAYSSHDLSPEAKTAISHILGSETIAFAAEWPDAIKAPFGALANTPEAKTFNHKHTDNHHWHFTNFPIGSSAYSASSPYAKADDISHAVKGCIAILEGTGSFDGITKLEALRFLVHLVGDAHQPLHTTFEQFDVSNHASPVMLKATPQTPAGAFMDGGGNALFYDTKQELHADWDDGLVKAIVKSKNTAKLVTTLQPDVSEAFDRSSGDYHQWIDAWLGESMKLVAPAFDGVKFDSYEEVVIGTRKTKKILVTLPNNYQTENVKVVRAQLIKGASHLVQLLNAIKWAH